MGVRAANPFVPIVAIAEGAEVPSVKETVLTKALAACSRCGEAVRWRGSPA